MTTEGRFPNARGGLQNSPALYNYLCVSVVCPGPRRQMLSVAVAFVAAILGAADAQAGVVIDQSTTVSSQGAPAVVRTRTLMVQGDQEKFDLDHHRWIVLDAKRQTATVVNDSHQTFEEKSLSSVTGSMQDPNFFLYSTLKSTGRTHEVLGLKCRDYSGSRHPGSFILTTTACFATDAAGADEFDNFIKAIVRGLGKPALNSLPGGVPLVIDSSLSVDPAFGPPDLSAREARRFRTAISKLPPRVTHVVVTRISSQTLPPETFTPPVGYTRRWPHEHRR